MAGRTTNVDQLAGDNKVVVRSRIGRQTPDADTHADAPTSAHTDFFIRILDLISDLESHNGAAKIAAEAILEQAVEQVEREGKGKPTEESLIVRGALHKLTIENHDAPSPTVTDAAPNESTVELPSATGTVRYTLPISLQDTLSSREVGELLSPTGRPHRSIAKDRRDSGELLGLKIGNAHKFPDFQFDRAKRRIRPVVAYANAELESREDPWGALDWWYTPERTFQGQRPVDLAVSEKLTEEQVDRAVGVDRRGMS